MFDLYPTDYHMTVYRNPKGSSSGLDYSFYLSNHDGASRLMNLTDLSMDEIEGIVGRFRQNHERAGKLKGEVFVYMDGLVRIKHHFTKKIIWENR